MSTRTVSVYDNSQDIFSYVEGKPTHVGRVVRDEYKGDDMYRYDFIPNQDLSPDDPEFKIYDLGVMREDTMVVDPVSALSPLLDNGWQLETFYSIREGRKFYAVLKNPDAQVSDIIDWDYGFWQSIRSNTPKNMYEGIVVSGGIIPRSSISYQRALFRLICTNGLTANIMDFGSVRMKHATFQANELISKLQGMNRNDLGGKLLGPRFGSPGHALRVGSYIRNHYLETDEAVPNNSSRDRIPGFLRNIHNTFESMPSWFLESYSDVITMMGHNLSGRDVHAVDILNAITNVVNREALQEEPHALGRVIMKQSALIEATEQLMGVMAFSDN